MDGNERALLRLAAGGVPRGLKKDPPSVGGRLNLLSKTISKNLFLQDIRMISAVT